MKVVNNLYENVSKVAQNTEEVQIHKPRKSVQRAINDQLSSSTGNGIESFNTIDTYIQKVAKRQYKAQNGVLYEDFLQDLRLKFWQIINDNKMKDSVKPKIMMQEFILRAKFLSSQSEGIVADNIEKFDENVFATSDSAISAFEKNDLLAYVTKLPGTHYSIKRENKALAMLREGYTIQEIRKYFGITKLTTRKFLNKVIRKANIKYNKLA